jgi:hypothetical protein
MQGGPLEVNVEAAAVRSAPLALLPFDAAGVEFGHLSAAAVGPSAPWRISTRSPSAESQTSSADIQSGLPGGIMLLGSCDQLRADLGAIAGRWRKSRRPDQPLMAPAVFHELCGQPVSSSGSQASRLERQNRSR